MFALKAKTAGLQRAAAMVLARVGECEKELWGMDWKKVLSK